MSEAKPVLDILIASTQRTGSGLLCELLRQSCEIGRVGEYLNPPHLKRGMEDSHLDMRSVVLDRIEEASQGRSRAVKLHYPAFRNLLTTFSVDELLPQKVVNVTRRDRLAQAVSLAKARATGAFSSDVVTAVVPQYDYMRILTALKQIRDQDAQWRILFGVLDIEPLEIVYEDLVASPDATVTDILNYLELEMTGTPVISNARRTVQRDAVNADWRARFSADYRSAELRGELPVQA